MEAFEEFCSEVVSVTSSGMNGFLNNPIIQFFFLIFILIFLSLSFGLILSIMLGFSRKKENKKSDDDIGLDYSEKKIK